MSENILFPAVTNREAFSQLIGLYDDDTGDALDLSQMTSVVLEVRRDRESRFDEGGYTPNYDYGGVNDYGPVIALSLGNGLSIVDLGQLQVSMTEAQMRTLVPDTYGIAMTMSNGADTRQIFVGRLPVLFGGVT